MYVPQFVCLVTQWRKSWVVSSLGQLWEVCYGHWWIWLLCGHMFSFPLGKYIGVELTGHGKYMFNFIRNYQIVFHNEHHFTCPSKTLNFQLLHVLANTWWCPSFQRMLLWLMICSASFHVLVNICITYFSKVFVQLFPFLQKVYWWIIKCWTHFEVLKMSHLNMM